jgi:hypothetical protein
MKRQIPLQAQLLIRLSLKISGTLLFILLNFASVSAQNQHSHPSQNQPSQPSSQIVAQPKPTFSGNIRPPQRTVRREGRGPCSSVESPTILAPTSYIGETISTHPTIVWSLPESVSDRYQIRLRLYEYSAQHRDLEEIISQILDPGTRSWTLPAIEQRLAVGKTYRWQITTRCNTYNEAGNPSIAAEFQVIETPTALINSLPSNTVARAKVYIENGLWYEAFAEILSFGTESALMYEIQDYLKQADLQARQILERQAQ